jgi:hypothetical protein
MLVVQEGDLIMNILFVNNFAHVDYLNDHIYNGLIHTKNVTVWETHKPWYMLKGCGDLSGMWGRGIGYGRMSHSTHVEDKESIRKKLKDKFYDKVIFGSVRRCTDFIDEACRFYTPADVAFCDGEDDTNIDVSKTKYGLYFKRELRQNLPMVFPISFSITVETLADKFLPKEKIMATCVPGDPQTYFWNFTNQKGYYKDYNRSYYGKTTKKAGWDCNRHYEIIGSHCIPYFPDIENCPPLTMTNFPKKIVIKMNEYSSQMQVHPEYEDILDQVFEYAKTNMTSVAVVQKMLMDKLA